MMHVEQTIRDAARKRIADIFRLMPDQVSMGAEFDKGLVCSFVSDWEYNEYDQLLHDVRDVADNATLKKLEKEEQVVRTVGDYCDHMVHCYETNPKEVIWLLGLDCLKT